MIDHQTPESQVWSSYSETVLLFAGEPEIRVDLRVQIPPATKGALMAIGLNSPFAVLTSFNPFGKNLTDAENARRFLELEAELKNDGLEYRVIDACSPDRAHCERSVGVCMERRAALDIARRWDQLAIFWFDQERFWICGVISAAEPIALPL
ncbi:MAG: DUF3293 domain-containing protein [Gemmatimonadaceae bacterium]